MTTCTHSPRIICENCAEAEIRNGSMKPMKGTVEADQIEFVEQFNMLSEVVRAEWTLVCEKGRLALERIVSRFA